MQIRYWLRKLFHRQSTKSPRGRNRRPGRVRLQVEELEQKILFSFFTAAQNFATGTGPQSVAVADVNRDGRPDLVIANIKSSSVSVLLGNGNGTFQGQRTFTTGTAPYAVAVADVNGDGKPDLAVANFSSGNVSVLLGNGDGTFAAAQNSATGSFPDAVAVADVNGDGKPDLVLSSRFGSANVSVLLGNGNGTFQAAQNFTTGSGPDAVAVADVNGDGKPDLVIGCYSSSTVSVLLGNGNGTFQASRTFGTGSGPKSVAVADFNGDGRLDLATANRNDGTASVLLGNGDGNFQAAQSFAVGVIPYSVAVADINGDGKPDLAVANRNSNSVSVLLGNGDGTFAAALSFGAGSFPLSVAVADVNGDGRPDLVTANYSSNNVAVLLNTCAPPGTGTFTGPQSFGTGSQPFSVAVADVTGDGKPDLVVANVGSDSVSVLLGNGNGTFAAAQNFATGSLPFSVAITDVNGDGRPDLVVANSSNGAGGKSVSVLLGNGNGTFQAVQNFATGASPVSVAVADFNGDGKPDLAVANESSDSVSVLLGNGNGTFAAAQNFAAGSVPESVAVADVNGDGKPDLAVANHGDNSVSVLLGNGNGTFAAAQNFAAGSVPESVAVADVNGDGKPDLVTANEGSDSVSVLLGNGNGTFAAAQNFATGYNPVSVAVADVNGDGRPDLTVVNGFNGAGGNSVSVLLGNGNGTFAAAQNFATGAQPNSVAVADVNGDGKPDLAVANQGDNSVSVLLGNRNAATHLQVTALATATAGTSLGLSVTALTAGNQMDCLYQGTLAFNSSDLQASLPPNYTFTLTDGGMQTFAPTLITAGSQTITATDTQTSSITGTSSAITVSAAPANRFALSAPSMMTAGTVITFTLTAKDPFNNIATGYPGTLHFSSSDPLALLPANSALTNGVATFGAGLRTTGNQTITATDTTNGTLTASATLSVSAAAASHLVLTAPGTAGGGTAFPVTVTAQDAFSNTATGYRGTIMFTKSDNGAASSVPDNYMFTSGDNGVHAFPAGVTLVTGGSQTVTATDTQTGTISGSAAITVTTGLFVTSFVVTPTGFSATFSEPFVNSSSNPINLYDAASANYGAPDVTLVGTSTGTVNGSLLINAANTGFTFVSGGGPLPPHAYTATFVSGAAAFQDTGGGLLNGNGSTPSNYVTTFTVTSSTAVVVSVPSFARGPDSTDVINVPNNSTNGIPITLSNGNGVTDANFTLSYNANLLSITGGNTTLADATFTVTTSGSGANALANITFHSPTALANGTVQLGGLTATVPANAPYQSKELLHFTSLSLNNGGITVTNDDAVQLVAFLGDTSGDGNYTGQDATLLSRVAAHADSGFAAYPQLDPLIIGDINGDGAINNTDGIRLNQFLSGNNSLNLFPHYPGPPSVGPTGPDPSLSIPLHLQASPGGTVTVPVNIDDPRPAGSTGVTQATLALQFDPKEFTVAPADIHLGSVPAAGTGWILQTRVDDATGQLGIILYSATPISSSDGGSLVTITFQVQPGVEFGRLPVQLVSAANPDGRVIRTTLADNHGLLSLHPLSSAPSPEASPTDVRPGPEVTGARLAGGSEAIAALGAAPPVAAVAAEPPVLDADALLGETILSVQAPPVEDEAGTASRVSGEVGPAQTPPAEIRNWSPAYKPELNPGASFVGGLPWDAGDQFAAMLCTGVDEYFAQIGKGEASTLDVAGIDLS